MLTYVDLCCNISKLSLIQQNKLVITTEVQLVRFEKKISKKLKKLLTNRKQHDKLFKLSLERATSEGDQNYEIILICESRQSEM